MRTVSTLLTVLTICASAWGQAFSIFDPAMQGPQVASLSSPTPDILWWKFEPGSGTTVTGNVGPNGALSSASQWIGGYSGSGYAVTNSSAVAGGITSATTLSYGNVLTVSVWVYRKSTSPGMIIESSSNYNATACSFHAYMDTSVGIRIRGAGGTSTYRNELFAPPALNEWHHCTFVFDARTSSGDVKFYLDGVNQTPTSTPNDNLWGAPFSFSSQTLYSLARGANTLYFTGGIDDLRIYSRELTASEITSIMSDPQ